LRIAVIGGGPGGLYFAYLWKRRHPEAQVDLFEQNADGATFGFGVVFSEQALEFLRTDDPSTINAIAPRMESWRNITLNLRGESVEIDGVGFSSIGRLELLTILQARARAVGVVPHYQTSVQSVDQLEGYDLIVAADGVNSLTRRFFEGDFGFSISYSGNKFAWYGTTKTFATLSQTFVKTDRGTFNAHHYRYSPEMSTFLVECDRATWQAYGFAETTVDESQAICEAVFADVLEGHALISNKSAWRNFPWVWNEHWSHRNVVLIGDALHSAHFSIGSGTRLAIEDAIALVKALEAEEWIDAALARYEASRKPIVKKLITAAKTSAAWYENFPEHMKLNLMDFAYSYITRSGRIDDARLAAMSPKFMARYQASKAGARTEAQIEWIDDRVPPDNPGAREIAFSIPERYNASRILFDNLRQGRGDKLALTGPAGTLTYGELCAEASRWGDGFASLGLERGDRILLFLDDTPAYPAAFFGAVRAGFVPLLINTLTPPDLLNFYLADSGARVAVADAEFLSRFNEEACKATQLATLIVVDGEVGDHAAPRTVVASHWLPQFSSELTEADTHRNEMAFWMYSSGSTGRPKGIVHLQHDMAYSDQAFAQNVLKLGPDDICFSVPKIFFAYGFGNAITFPFSAGAATLLLPGQPKPAAIFGAIEKFRPTVFFGLPTLYTALTKADGATEADFSSLRMAVSAAEVLSSEVFNGWKALTGIEIMEGLGSTEALHIYLCNRPDWKKPGAAGLRVPGYEIALKDKDGREVGDGEEGIMWVRGDSATPLYWNRPDKTAETIRDEGWIYTGDRFVRDADGFHFFRGRADDLIKISGQWVYPLEVELCLAEHPDIRECAVYAAELPDRRMTLKAVVVMNRSCEDRAGATRQLQDYVKAKLLPYKYPREIIFIDELPKTGTGKIDRQAVMRI
jgi:benzoate-CoA ligase family protein